MKSTFHLVLGLIGNGYTNIFSLTHPVGVMCPGGTESMLLNESICICMPSFRSTGPGSIYI